MRQGFQCKQFYVAHDACAMKVTEMACLLGAVCPIPFTCTHILDIGCGTGLLSLMLAQRTNANIIALDINASAVQQAQENIVGSPFSNRISVKEVDFTHYQANPSFDLIVSNPPFFNNHLRSADKQKSMAWHDDALPLSALFKGVKAHLSSAGIFVVLLPIIRETEAEKTGKLNKLFCHMRIGVRHQEKQEERFVILGFSNQPNIPVYYKSIIMRDEQRSYTEQVHALFKPFYLNL